MADIQSAAQWIGRLLVEEAKYLSKIEDKVKELRDELEWMHCFLRQVDAISQHDNVMARRWIAQIREFAYEAEDIIEKFLVRVVPSRRGRGDRLFSLVRKYSRILWEIRELHKIGHEIDSLKGKISALTSRLHTYGIDLKLGESGSETSSACLSRSRHKIYSSTKEAIIIGRDDCVRNLVNKLVAREIDGETRVFAICGVGGVGKTFVAKKIFHQEEIRRYFKAFAWAYVSQPCQISSVQQQLLSSLTSKSTQQIAQMTDSELKDELRKVLRKRKSFVVLDGVWGQEVWDSLKEAFPITNQESQSKLLVTTRLEQVARHVDQSVSICELKCLSDDQSKMLLKAIGGAPVVTSGQEDQTGCDVNKLRDDMLKHCGGLPLAITLLGGVLATKKKFAEWKKVHMNLSSYLINEGELPPWRRILELSYYELPYQLKPCFLYLGYFPTNLEIPKRKITQLWEAEGLVTAGEDEMSEDTLQDVAENCLGELVERSLVQVGSRGLSGKAKTCRLHALMRELCMSKASKGNWLNIVQLGADQNDQPSGASSSANRSSSKSSKSVKRRFRRLAIYCSDTLEKLPSDYRNAKYIRSLLFFNTLKSEDVLIPLKQRALRKAFRDFKLLRVLDIENIEVQSLPQEVGFLIHLRYLSLRGSWVSKLPSTLKNLRCLQTLDLRVLSFVRLRIPDVLWRMERLIHLYLPPKSFLLRGNALKLRLRGLINLETLVNFSNMCQARDVCKLSNLRKFSSCDFLSEQETINFLASSSLTLGHIEHVSLRLDGQILKQEPLKLRSCKHLRKLWVKGPITESISSLELPENLVELSFWHSKFQHDPMPVLEKLRHLKRLSLEKDSYDGATMSCSRAGFQELSYLTLKGLANLEDWKVEEEAMPKLVGLEINRCQKLKMIPEGLRFVKSLQELRITYMPLSFYQHKDSESNNKRKNWVPVNDIKEWLDFSKVEHVLDIKISHILDLELQK